MHTIFQKTVKLSIIIALLQYNKIFVQKIVCSIRGNVANIAIGILNDIYYFYFILANANLFSSSFHTVILALGLCTCIQSFIYIHFTYYFPHVQNWQNIVYTRIAAPLKRVSELGNRNVLTHYRLTAAGCI